MIDWNVYIIVIPSVFLAGLIDAVAGGGGLLSVPAYLAAGLPPQLALGTNKLSSCAGTSLATWRYLRRGYIDLRTAAVAASIAMIGAYLGARSLLAIDPILIRYALLLIVPVVAVLTLLDTQKGARDLSHTLTGRRRWFLLLGFALLIGFYDGIFGPGTGSFLLLFFTWMLRYDLLRANGNTKFVNLATNLAALITFIVSDQVAYQIGLPAAIASLAGNWLGSQLVMLRGSRMIRPVFLLTLLMLLSKVAWDLMKLKMSQV